LAGAEKPSVAYGVKSFFDIFPSIKP
jgi:hypothetical protein